jgi:hypothetical protein
MLYLDTEFNAFGGELISLALVSDRGDEFYRVLPLPSKIHPWVGIHVIPFLNQPSEQMEVVQQQLYEFLQPRQSQPIYADWPADLEHLLRLIYFDNGLSYNLQLTLKLIKSGEFTPEIPHNALSDARALRDWHESELIKHEAAIHNDT